MSQYTNRLMTCMPGMPGNAARTALIKRCCCGIVLLLVAASMAQAADWSWEVVDPSAGQFSSMQFDTYGNAHVSYVAASEHQLRYAFWDHGLKKWFTTPLDTSGGFCALALDSHQRPHISYLSYGGVLMYARWDGTSWNKQRIPILARTIEFYTSIALDLNDHPSIGYYEVDDAEGERLARLRTVMWNGEYWALTTVDATRGTGKFNSITVDSKGRPHIAYATVAYENASLRYGHWNGASWETEILEGKGFSSTSWSVAMLLDKDDNPHITYTDVPHRLVKYATQKAGRWKIEVVDSLAREGYPDRNGIALDDGGNPYISYYDAAVGWLKVAHRQGSVWITEVVDSNFSGFQSSLRIDHRVLWVTYADQSTGALKCARRQLE